MYDQDEMYRIKAEILKALAHPSRLVIVEELCKGERCVCELQQAIGADMSTVSRHLSVMKAAGVVRHRKVGNRVFYRLQIRCAADMLKCVEAMVQEGFQGRRAAATM